MTSPSQPPTPNKGRIVGSALIAGFFLGELAYGTGGLHRWYETPTILCLTIACFAFSLGGFAND